MNERNSAANKRIKSETISVTLTFSIALAPFQIAAIVIITAINWKKTT